MSWQEILNTGRKWTLDPSPDTEIYGPPIIIGDHLISQIRGHFAELTGEIEILIQIKSLIWSALDEVAQIVHKMGQDVRKSGVCSHAFCLRV